MTWEAFEEKISAMRAIVEAFIEGDVKQSPSAQYRINPLGQIEIVSTHDQVLGGPTGQVFLGCRFPADAAYRREIQDDGLKAAHALRDAGVLGRFGVDFISVRNGDDWTHYAIEINLRKGRDDPSLPDAAIPDGRLLRSGHRTVSDGGGEALYYRASDNLEDDRYRGLTPRDLIDISVMNGLHYDAAGHRGVVFHLISTLSEFGKIGLVCLSDDPNGADALYDRTIAVLDRESEASAGHSGRI